MEIFDSRYYKSCKVLMEMLGLWPYQALKRKRLTYIIFYSLHGSLLLPQVIRLLQTKDFNIIVENTISILFLFVCIAKYAVSYTSGPNFKLLFTQIAADWQNITDKSEREILSKYGNDGRFASLFYTFYVFWAWATYNMMPFLPPILDIVLPLPNGSHPLLLPFYANYIFFEQLDYHYETALHAFFVYFFATSLFAGIDTIYVSTVKHTCGLFAIICYRLETLAKTDENKASIEFRSDKVVHHDLKNTIIMHNDTIRSCRLLEESFSLCFLLIQSLCVVTIALGGFYMLCIYNDAYKLLRVVAFYTGTVLHLLYLHYVGQQIIDSSEKIFNSAYSSEWYLISTNARKLTKVIMIRSLYPCHLTAGKITSLSMETFGSLMKTSMSYFTVLLSLE